MAFTEPTPGEAQTAAEVAAARQAFLSEPPEILSTDEPTVDDAAQTAADEAAALDELTKPPAAPEGAASPAAPAPSPAPTGTTPDPFAAFGGEEKVRLAHQVQEALRTEQGVRTLVAEGLQALGYSVEQIRAALDGAAAGVAGDAQAPAAAPAATDLLTGLDDDDVVDVKTIRQFAAQVAAQAAEQAVKQAAAQANPAQAQLEQVQRALLAQQQQAVTQYTDTAIIETLGAVPEDAAALADYRAQVDATLERAVRYYNPDLAHDPNHIRQAVVQANAELTAEADARFKAYLSGKKRARDAQPVNVGGGAGAEGALPEPKNMAEARQQARDTGFFK